MQFASASDIGLVRDGNQDVLYTACYDDYALFVMADGMGGHNGGQLAAEMAVQRVQTEIAVCADVTKGLPVDAVRLAIARANKVVYRHAQQHDELLGMGTTLSMMLYAQGQWAIGHVGDSRIYRLHKKHFSQVTVDHTVVGDMVEKGEITAEEALVHPHRNWLRRAVGVDVWVNIDIIACDYDPTDRWLLCSDGLTAHVSDQEIAEQMQKNADPQTICDALVGLALFRGGYDNTSVILIREEVL